MFGATVVAYLPSLRGEFLWDDDAHVTANPSIVGTLGLARIWMSSAANYFPLTTSTLWVIHALWGLKPLPYHVTDVLLHAASAGLLWLVLRRLRVPGAWFGAMLWALHPVQVESAAWISEIKNTQSAVFFLLATWCFLRWIEAEAPQDHGDRWGYYVFAWLGTALAILSMASTVMLPVVFGLCWWWMRGRWRWRYLFWLLPFLAISITVSAWTIWEQKFHSGALGQDWNQTWLQRVVLSGKVFWFYLGKLLWPHPLIFIYPRWALDATRAVSYLPVLAAVGGLGFLWWRRHGRLRPVFFAAAVFGVCLFPVLGLFNVYFFRYSFVGDHFQYLSSMAAMALAGAGFVTAGGWLGARHPWLAAAPGGVLLLFGLGVLTWHQCGMYRDTETLFLTTLARNPSCLLARNNLGIIWAKQPGRLNDAIAQYQEALRLDPNYVETHNGLGAALAELPGRLNDAISQYQEALRLKPDFAEAHNNLGTAFARLPGRQEDAIIQFQEALRLLPDFTEAHNNLGNAWSQMPGRLDDAIAEYQAALRLQPDYAEAHYNLGLAWARMPGRLNDAIAQFRETVRLQPDHTAGWHNLGVCWYRLGDLPAAVAAFREELRLSPNDPDAQQALAEALRQAKAH